tara:strand:- start:283 stop:579 length:297 start_codon:yes stop_codon:yes gene_type:complete
MKVMNVHPTMDLSGKSEEVRVNDRMVTQYIEPKDGFVLIHGNDQPAPSCIDESAKLNTLKSINKAIIISSESYQLVSSKSTKKGNVRSVYLPGQTFEL